MQRTVELRLKSTTLRDRDALLAELQTLFGDRLHTTHVPGQLTAALTGRPSWVAYVQIAVGGNAAAHDFTDADFEGLEGT